MHAFSELIDRLVLTPSRHGKLTLLRDYFSSTSDPTGAMHWQRSPAPLMFRLSNRP